MTTNNDSERSILLSRDDKAKNYDPVRKFVTDLKGDPDAATAEMLAKTAESCIAGKGGPGARVGKKMAAVRNAPGPSKVVVANGDESEPGTFKDKALMEKSPYLVVMGAILAALTVGAEQVYIYIRREYGVAIEAMKAEVRRAALLLGINGPSLLGSGRVVRVEVFVSAGGYICGDQTAILEALEGRRAEPRIRPPEPETCGLRGMPTLVNNVETLAWYSLISLHGAQWYRDLGVNGAYGRRLFSVSGDVVRPGVFEVPNGTPLGDLILGRAGGPRPGRMLKAIATSGPSGGFLPVAIPIDRLPANHRSRLPEGFVRRRLAPGAAHLDTLALELNLEVFRALDLALGAGIVVYDDHADMLEQAASASLFFRDESCGKCVPCRLGTQQLVKIATCLLQTPPDAAALDGHRQLVDRMLDVLGATSICGLGAVAAAPLASVIRYFSDDIINN
jgi:NADH:ubiquinone oxidoreductase subunit F (NADH-binding)